MIIYWVICMTFFFCIGLVIGYSDARDKANLKIEKLKRRYEYAGRRKEDRKKA